MTNLTLKPLYPNKDWIIFLLLAILTFWVCLNIPAARQVPEKWRGSCFPAVHHHNHPTVYQPAHNQRSSPLQFLENCHSSGRLESPSDNCQTSQAGSIPSFGMCQWILRPILSVFIILSVKIWQTDNLESLGLINCQVDLTWCSDPILWSVSVNTSYQIVRLHNSVSKDLADR